MSIFYKLIRGQRVRPYEYRDPKSRLTILWILTNHPKTTKCDPRTFGTRISRWGKDGDVQESALWSSSEESRKMGSPDRNDRTEFPRVSRGQRNTMGRRRKQFSVETTFTELFVDNYMFEIDPPPLYNLISFNSLSILKRGLFKHKLNFLIDRSQ